MSTILTRIGAGNNKFGGLDSMLCSDVRWLLPNKMRHCCDRYARRQKEPIPLTVYLLSPKTSFIPRVAASSSYLECRSMELKVRKGRGSGLKQEGHITKGRDTISQQEDSCVRSAFYEPHWNVQKIGRREIRSRYSTIGVLFNRFITRYSVVIDAKVQS